MLLASRIRISRSRASALRAQAEADASTDDSRPCLTGLARRRCRLRAPRCETWWFTSPRRDLVSRSFTFKRPKSGQQRCVGGTQLNRGPVTRDFARHPLKSG
jgi:hypothetical protein